jgi:hypothetical protein
MRPPVMQSSHEQPCVSTTAHDCFAHELTALTIDLATCVRLPFRYERRERAGLLTASVTRYVRSRTM